MKGMFLILIEISSKYVRKCLIEINQGCFKWWLCHEDKDIVPNNTDRDPWWHMALLDPDELTTKSTHWGRDKMDAIAQAIFSSAFFLTEMFEFCLRFH